MMGGSMIEYSETFGFDNEVGHFTVHASTEEHPSDYGNGTMLVLDIESDFPCERRRCFDVRYEPVSSRENIASLARSVIYNEFGLEV